VNLDENPRSEANTSLLRFLTCGSVDDGKSTLIGRLLYESKLLYADQRRTLDDESKRLGTAEVELDASLLLDGLAVEREEGTTIDVAYRVFSTDKRKFIVADTPGHEQYTRNMVTGASMADLAVVLIDARRGVLVQTRRHSLLVSLMGIRRVVLAINKLDLVDFSKAIVDDIERDYRVFAASIGLTDIVCIPLSAKTGDNVTRASENMPWYKGPTLIEYLETVTIDGGIEDGPLRLPVQWVNRSNPDFRGYAGRIVGGAVCVGDRIRVLPSGKESNVARIVTRDGDLNRAVAGQSITLTLRDDIDISRGDLLAAADSPPGVADQFEATVIWMSEHEMLPGRSYLLKLGAKTVGVTIATLKYKVNVNSLEHIAAKTLQLNEIGVCNLNLDQVVAFDAYRDNRDTGGFILIDRFSNETIGAGLLHFALRRSQNIHWQAIEVNKQARGSLKGHSPCVVWFTGLSGAGKSTIANVVEKRLHALGRHTYLLDGDNVRHGLSKDLGFTEADRVENIRRVAEVARLMVDAGLIVLVSFISPFRAERRMARQLVAQGEFIEVFVDTPIAVAEQRDPKGLYAKARRGELNNFTGIDSPYERPEHADVVIATLERTSEEAADLVIARMRIVGVLS
jgi:bifunctional enzyme CysN/CysC